MEFLTATQNLPFAIALTLMLFMAVLQAFSVFSGGAEGMAVDTDAAGAADTISADAAAPDAGDLSPHADTADVSADGAFDQADAHHAFGHTLIYSILGWLQVGKIPTMIVLVLLLMTFGVGGLVLQKIVEAVTGSLLHPALASIPAAVFAVFSSGLIGRWVAPVIPRDETEALSSDSFLGLSATIIRGTASRNRPAEAKFQDRLGRTHYIMVEPEDPNVTFQAGDEVQMILRKDARYLVIASPYKMSEIKRLTANHPPQANL